MGGDSLRLGCTGEVTDDEARGGLNLARDGGDGKKSFLVMMGGDDFRRGA